jgi:ribosomal protein L37AE/L43A
MRQLQSPPFNLCAQCGAALIAPIWAEHLDERHVKNLWSCEACGYQFDTSVYFPERAAAGDQPQPPLTIAPVH